MLVCELVIHIMSLLTSPRHSPHNAQQIIDLTFLTEEEETSLRSVLVEDQKLQQAEENRLKYTLVSLCFNTYDYHILQVVAREH